MRHLPNMPPREHPQQHPQGLCKTHHRLPRQLRPFLPVPKQDDFVPILRLPQLLQIRHVVRDSLDLGGEVVAYILGGYDGRDGLIGRGGLEEEELGRCVQVRVEDGGCGGEVVLAGCGCNGGGHKVDFAEEGSGKDADEDGVVDDEGANEVRVGG